MLFRSRHAVNSKSPLELPRLSPFVAWQQSQNPGAGPTSTGHLLVGRPELPFLKFQVLRFFLSRVKPLGRFATTKLAGGEGPQVVAGDNLGTLCIINCYHQLVSRQVCSFPLSPTPFRLIAATPAAALLGLYAIL